MVLNPNDAPATVLASVSAPRNTNNHFVNSHTINHATNHFVDSNTIDHAIDADEAEDLPLRAEDHHQTMTTRIELVAQEERLASVRRENDALMAAISLLETDIAILEERLRHHQTDSSSALK